MKKKKIRIKWKNVALIIILLLCAALIIHDFYMIAIQPWINGRSAQWTWFGFVTFILAFIIGGAIIDYFNDEINKK